MIGLDIAWGLLVGVASWLPSWLMRSNRWRATALDLIVLFAGVFVYWQVVDPSPRGHGVRVCGFSLGLAAATTCGVRLRRRRALGPARSR